MVFGNRESTTITATATASNTAIRSHNFEIVLAELRALHDLNIQQRQHLRSMGEQAGVGIEPPQQTELLDATMQVPGVIAAGVPGAGGVDAVFTLVLGTATSSVVVRTAVEALWSSWGRNADQAATLVGSVCPLLLSADVGIQAGVRAEFDLGW